MNEGEHDHFKCSIFTFFTSTFSIFVLSLILKASAKYILSTAYFVLAHKLQIFSYCAKTDLKLSKKDSHIVPKRFYEVVTLSTS